jgi:outer membrane protein TolC
MIGTKRRFDGVNVGRGETITTHQMTFPALFEIDLWSRLAKASKAARDDILVDEENRRTVAQTLVKRDGPFFEFKTKDTTYE